MGWQGCQEVVNTRPLFLAIYATVIVGVVFSSFYVFSAIYSANSEADPSTSWLSSRSPSFSSAMDTKLLEALYWKGVPVFDMGSHMSTIDVGWGSPTFHKMGREKVILIDSVLPFGYELLMCDTDMVWLKNPLPYLARFPGADVLTSSDQVIPTVVDDRLDIWQQVSGAYNIGIFHWRPTDSAKKLAKEWKDMLLADEKIWDQNGFNDIVRRQLGPSVDEESGLAYAFDGNLKLGILPASIFCSGHTYFVQAMYQQLRLQPYAVHTTFQYAGTEGKRHRLREAMVFYDPPEYYNSPGGFLSFRPSIPKSLLLDGEHNIESHFSLVNYQMKQIRTALAIASLLNRTLVMPPLWCRLDRLWFAHPGILQGSMTRQPFVCPLDHVFEVNVMLKEMPEEEFGPGIDIREYTFLDNPSMPKQVKESWLDVQLCQEGTQDCRASNDTSSPGIIRFPKHSNEETFKAIFSSFKDVKVIQFSSMQDAFLGFSDKTREQRFRNRVKRYVGIWCCVDHHTPGHIYYDMYWDEKPGWKPTPPKTPEDDHPPL
ncbi:arabinosyltransferase XEG113-like isoform X2 [Juglans microcarpa x Juglans regia]|uniref:arabinosyltransferase XEG113-like isoform X2 n=1 Tax=Juglans microcarpa x Juglans regia TaxID=2249226 RepID=UPI001B7DA65A|nr:arabinosyltransferase XEG113-like isoform X2 [Juglans microcarpa x Juglans regia]